MVKQNSFKKFYKKYLNDGIKLKRYQKVGIMLLVVVVAGFVGWLYEFLLAWASNGRIYMQGGNFLPWMNIYAIGAVLLTPIVVRFKKKPWVAFLVALAVTWIVELVGGWLVYTLGNGTRYWNYDEGVWLIGNINGFVCLLSVVIFAIGALMLVYLVLPVCDYLATKMSKRAFLSLSIALFALVMVDEVGNLICKNAGLPTAMDFWRSIGLEYKNY